IVSFPMPTAGTYEFRFWQNCATNPAKSPTVTVQGTVAATVKMNDSSAPITVVPGSTVAVGIQNGPGNPSDCVSLYPAGLPDNATTFSYLNCFYLHDTNSFPTRRSSDLIVSFPMPTAGTYEFRFWQNCATILAKSQIVTVQ